MSLAKALLDFQADAPALQRDALNPHFKSKFISLEQLMGNVMPVANKHGLVVTQFPTIVDGLPALRTRITHAQSGEHLEDVMLLQAEREGPQAQGSALTYARRYSLMAALGLVADEDDDANSATKVRARGNGEPERITENVREAFVDVSEAASAATRASEAVIHFGKNKGTKLGDLTPRQLAWYANEWKVQQDASEYDHTLKAAAAALHAGQDDLLSALQDPYADVPFA